MGFVDKIREVMNAPGDDDYEYEDDFEETTDDSDFVNDYSERSESRSSSKNNKVVNTPPPSFRLCLLSRRNFPRRLPSAIILTINAPLCSISSPLPRTLPEDSWIF